MNKQLSFAGALGFGSILLFAAPARAGLDSCGNIHVEADAKCELDVSGGCEAKCTPVALRAQCSVEIEASCKGMCTGSAQASCTASCDVSACRAKCDVKPASFDCSAQCQAEGSASCEGQCEAGDGHGECVASCQASYSARCDASCDVQRGSVDCEASCEASCKGQCDAKANVNCDVECSSDGYAKCEAELEGGCKAHCSAPEGALFCDGQYVDYGNNLEECTAALQAVFNIKVEGHSSSSGECKNGSCEGQAEASGSASCAVTPGSSGGLGGSWLLAGLGLAAFGARRRRS